MKNVYSVSWVNAYLKDMIVNDILLKTLYVKGEASNVKYHSSGHLYFTLKDRTSIIQCAMFSGYQKKGLHFRLKDGDEVIVGCSVDLYEKGGSYKLKVMEIYQAGAGRINEAFEKLKAELEEMGMFDACYKQKLPDYINRIGVVAAYPGEAVHDIVENATRRNPFIEILVYPAYVQGKQAPLSIVRGIDTLRGRNVDVIILARGGGSTEDLWAFNERMVADAVFNCPIPIVSAIGHEQQVSISDLVADMRVSTPTAAAVAVTKDIREVFLQFETYEERYYQIIQRKLRLLQNQLEQKQRQVLSLSPKNKLKEQRLKLVHSEKLLIQYIDRHILQATQRLDHDSQMLSYGFDRKWQLYKQQFTLLSGRMDAVSPLKKLSGGYAFVKNEAGEKITGVSDLAPGEKIFLHYLDGCATASVTGIKKDDVYLKAQS